MKKKTSQKRGIGIFARLHTLYARMASQYAEKAEEAGLSCAGCTDNCCTSYFQHHTYIEWAYLWKGMILLPQKTQKRYLDRAHSIVKESEHLLAEGKRPRLMCPVNDDGLCGMYEHRLMICRMHGTRNMLQLPDGRVQTFPGCITFQTLMSEQAEDIIPTLDRTSLYKELVTLEMAYVGTAYHSLPRVNMTLAEMLVNGPPKLR